MDTGNTRNGQVLIGKRAGCWTIGKGISLHLYYTTTKVPRRAGDGGEPNNLRSL